jgi:hypothetical protein
VLFRCYVDDSTEEKVRIFTVGGFVASEDTWIALEPDWVDFQETLKAKGISYFHTTDCFSGANEFEGILSHERREMIDRVQSMVLSHKLRLIGYGTEELAYKQFAPKRKRNDFGVNHYVTSFEGAIKSTCESINRDPYGEVINDVCDFYIENSDYKLSATEAVQNLKKNSLLWFSRMIGSDTYGDKKGERAIPLLQIADYGAFLANKHLTQADDRRIPWRPYYEELDKARLVWPIVKWDEKSLRLIHGIRALPELDIDELWPDTNDPRGT